MLPQGSCYCVRDVDAPDAALGLGRLEYQYSGAFALLPGREGEKDIVPALAPQIGNALLVTAAQLFVDEEGGFI